MNNLPPIKYPFGSWKYKILKRCYLYLSPPTVFLDIFGAIITVIIACLAYSNYPNSVLWCGIIYVVTQIIRAILTASKRIERESIQRKAIHAFLCDMNRKMFGRNSSHQTFTLFTIDPVNTNYIIPYVRFSVGGRGINDAEESKAYYPKGISYTGQAWKSPNKYISTAFPLFKDRDDFENWYINEINIPREIVKNISDRMVGVKQIFCFGFVDNNDQFIGVLSLDSTVEWNREPKKMAHLGESLQNLKTILNSFYGK